MSDAGEKQKFVGAPVAAADSEFIREIELAVDAEIERDGRAQWVREASGIAATIAGLAAVGSAVAAAPEVLAAAALATGAGAVIGSAGAVIGRVVRGPGKPRDGGLFVRRPGRRKGSAAGGSADPLADFAISRLAARQYLTAASKDPSLVSQESRES